MLGNIIGIGFAAISDIWINGFTFRVAIVGEFIPAAGPNLIFAAVCYRSWWWLTPRSAANQGADLIPIESVTGTQIYPEN